MSGVLNAMVAQRHDIYGLTINNSSGNTVGAGPAFAQNSISPSTFRGYSILHVISESTGFDFKFALNTTDDLFQAFFTFLRVQDSDGNFRTFLTSDATFTTGTFAPTWEWGVGSNPVWVPGDDGETKTMEIV